MIQRPAAPRALASPTTQTPVCFLATTKSSNKPNLPFVDSASSAVRNLNDYEIMGRKLRVDFSNDQKSTDDDNQVST